MPRRRRASLRISGTGGAIGTIRALGDAFRKPRPDMKIVIPPSLGSSGAIKALRAGKLDIAVSARLPSPDERETGYRTSERSSRSSVPPPAPPS